MTLTSNRLAHGQGHRGQGIQVLLEVVLAFYLSVSPDTRPWRMDREVVDRGVSLTSLPWLTTSRSIHERVVIIKGREDYIGVQNHAHVFQKCAYSAKCASGRIFAHFFFIKTYFLHTF